MTMTPDWQDLYVPDDGFRSRWRKSDLVFLLHKYGRRKDGFPPTKTELGRIHQRVLNFLWGQIKPLEFGKDPRVAA